MLSLFDFLKSNFSLNSWFCLFKSLLKLFGLDSELGPSALQYRGPKRVLGLFARWPNIGTIEKVNRGMLGVSLGF